MKPILILGVAALFIFAVCSAGCIMSGGNGLSDNNPTDTTTQMTLSLKGNELTRYIDKYTTIPIGTISGSPAQLSVSLKNGYKITVNPKKIVFTGAGKTITSDTVSKTATVTSGSNKITITAENGAVAEENGRTITYGEDGSTPTKVYKDGFLPDWYGLKIVLKNSGGKEFFVTEKSFYDMSDQKNSNSFSLEGANSLIVTQTPVRVISKVVVDVVKNKATVTVQYYDPNYRKVTQSMSLTWNGEHWTLLKQVEYYDVIDKEELSG